MQNILICGLKAKTQLLVCNKMYQQNINQQEIGKTTVQGILSDWKCLFHVEIGAVLHKT